MCEQKGCTTKGCRQLSHHGVLVFGECPRGCKRGIDDYIHYLGVACHTCGAYWIPESVPRELITDAKPWELGRWSNVGHGAGSIPQPVEAVS